MKIESRHGNNLPKSAVCAVLLAATTFISSCDGGAFRKPDPTSVQYEGDIQIASDIDDDATSESSTDESSVPDDSLTGSDSILTSIGGAFGDPCVTTSEQYDLFMGKINELEKSEPGSYQFVISAAQDKTTERYFFVLITVKGVYAKCYTVVSGELTELESKPADLGISTASAKSYEDIRKLPFLVDTSYLLHNEVREEGIKKDLPTPVADTVEDGDYYGEIIGVKEDGTAVLLKIGKPVILDYNYINDEVEPGSMIGFKDFIKMNDKVEFEDKHNGIVVTSPSYDFDTVFYFDQYRTNRGITNKAYLKYDFDYWADDYVIVELPLAEDCKVYNYGEYFKAGKEYDPNWDENGDPMTHTLFFVQLRREKDSYPYDSGWIIITSDLHTSYTSKASATSVIVENGQVKILEMHAHVHDY